MLAADLAQDGWRVALGIEVKRSDTDLGCLRRCESIGAHDFRVAQFVDKPDLDLARQFVTDSGYA